MKVVAAPIALTQTPADLLGIVVHEDGFRADPTLKAADAELAGVLADVLASERFSGKMGQTVVVHTQGRLPAKRLAVVGAGPAAARTGAAELRHAAARFVRLATSVGARSLALLGPAAALEPPRRLSTLAEGLLLGAYRFDKYLSNERRPPPAPETVTLDLVSSGLSPADAELALARARRVADAIARARDLVNEPAGAMTPAILADHARRLAEQKQLEITVLGPEECRARGMGLFLAVAQGSNEEPRFIHLAWKPAGARRRVVIIGKGVTFDSGGLSLKSTENMLTMKSDMAGAAAVISAIGAVADEKLPVEVHALAACTENMPSGRAYKLGDVLRSMAGKTVEINNTDAEGRLTLADAITYALTLAPDEIADFATLTGACVVALGPHTAGVISNDEALSQGWLKAAREAGEDAWPLPLPQRLVDQLKSEVADMRNTGERWGGALTAGLFLKEFAGTTPWVHFDIAGPAHTDKEWGAFGKGGTGYGVASILEYLRALTAK